MRQLQRILQMAKNANGSSGAGIRKQQTNITPAGTHANDPMKPSVPATTTNGKPMLPHHMPKGK